MTDVEQRAVDLRAWADDLRKRRSDPPPEYALCIIEIEQAAALNEIASALSLLAHKSGR